MSEIPHRYKVTYSKLISESGRASIAARYKHEVRCQHSVFTHTKKIGGRTIARDKSQSMNVNSETVAKKNSKAKKKRSYNYTR